MITLRLSDDEAIRVLVVMEQNLYDLIELFNRSQNMSLIKTITKGRFIVHELRRVLNLTEYAAEIDKLEAMESTNDSKGMGTTTAETVREGNDARCEQCWHNTVIGSNLRTSMGRPADDISDQEAGSQPVGKG